MTRVASRTLYDKLWDSHVVREEEGVALLYIDRHLIHEVTSPQAFAGLDLAARKLWRPEASLAVADHNVPTTAGEAGIVDPVSRQQVETLAANCSKHQIRNFSMGDPRQGVVHVVGPEQGATLPGMTVVCGDSHTSTHGAFAALAFGIGTSEVEHVLATQCLEQKKAKNLLVKVEGRLTAGVSAKDLILAIIGQIGTGGGTGCALEFAGPAIDELSMEGRMTLCNMAIEAGARTGLVAVDNKTIDYIFSEPRPYAPQGELKESALAAWKELHSDKDAIFAEVVTIDAGAIQPQVTWGTSPEMVVGISDSIPALEEAPSTAKRNSWEQALKYMGLQAGTKIQSIKLDKIFIGSCTNGRIEDLRTAAAIVQGRHIAENIKLALVVPGSGPVKAQAEAEGLDLIFRNAGFEWREPGCSMCLAMNADRLEPGERCASTSNRNFEGRQGAGGRTHLVSPAMAAAAALAGSFVDVRALEVVR